MKWIVFSAVLLSGCYYLGQNTHKDIIVHPSATWSGPELLTVIMEAGNHNLRDDRTNIKAIATPYYPSVIKAIGRRAQVQYHWSEREMRNYVDRLVHQSSGMYIDWEQPHEPVYSKGLDPLYSPTQFDSVMFLLTIRNNGWPCGKMISIYIPTADPNIPDVNMVVPLEELNCPTPDISDLEGRIVLVNEEGTVLDPIVVWGKRMNFLTNNEETLFVKFRLWCGGQHFLAHSEKFYLTITGFEREIRLTFPTRYMK